MPFPHAITHAIARQGPGQAVTLQIREAELPVSGYLEELLRELKHSFVAKAGRQYGRFHPDSSVAQVAQWLRQQGEGKLDFSAFSRRASEHFKSLLENTELVVEGHLLFALESLADGDSLYVFLVQHSEGVYFDGGLELEVSRHLEVSGVLLGARVELDGWQEEGCDSYLSVLRARGDRDLTELFWQWLGFAEPRDTSAETNTFLEAVSAFAERMPEEEAQQYRHKVVDFCLQQDKDGEAVQVAELSAHLDEREPERFARFVAEQAPVPERLFPDRRQLKQYVRISGRNDLLSMSFAAECLGDSVVYDKQEDRLIIRNIPTPLKMRLIRHLQGGSEGDDAGSSGED